MAVRTRDVMICTDDGRFELAVNPTQITVSSDNGDKTIDLLNVGIVMLPGHRNPIKLSLQTFLPSSDSPFYKGIAPETIIAMMKKAKNGQRSIRLIISGTDINHKFIINSASETYQEGQKDISISWSLTEDRFSSINSVASVTAGVTETGLNQRPSTRTTPKSVCVKKDDTLWDLAVHYYGDGNRWKEIAELNGITEPKRLQIGTTLEMPE